MNKYILLYHNVAIKAMQLTIFLRFGVVGIFKICLFWRIVIYGD